MKVDGYRPSTPLLRSLATLPFPSAAIPFSLLPQHLFLALPQVLWKMLENLQARLPVAHTAICSIQWSFLGNGLVRR